MKRQSKPETAETTKTEGITDTANQEGSLSRENVPLEVREEAYLRARYVSGLSLRLGLP